MIILELFLAFTVMYIFIRFRQKSKKNIPVKRTGRRSNMASITAKHSPYRDKFILTDNEYSFYTVLKKVADDENWIVFLKVAMKNLFEVVLSDEDSFSDYFDRISDQHIDFLICNEKLRSKFALELEGDNRGKNSHKTFEKFPEDVFEGSRMRFIRIPYQDDYSEDYVRRCFGLPLKPQNDKQEAR